MSRGRFTPMQEGVQPKADMPKNVSQTLKISLEGYVEAP